MNTGVLEAVGALLALGALHGINPGMGWLFAVALGMQEKRGRAVWRALVPLAWGHAFAIATALAIVFTVGTLIPRVVLQHGVSAALIAFGLYRLRRHAHPAFGGMRVRPRELAIWSFLVATAHGAGLMVLPFVLPGGREGGAEAHASHAAHLLSSPPLLAGLASPELAGTVLMTAAHTAGYLAATAALSLLVFYKIGLARLRNAWINLNLVWSVVLIVSGVVTWIL